MPAYVEPTATQRVVEAAAGLPPGAAVTGWAALRWHGGHGFDGLDPHGLEPTPVQIAAPAHLVRPRPGVSISGERLDASRDLQVVDGVTVVTVQVALSFVMRRAPDLRAAVSALNLAAFHDLSSLEEARAFADARRTGCIGASQSRRAIELGDENAWSVQETLTHLSWRLDARRPVPLLNRPLFDDRGRHLLTPDLIDPEAGVVGEYNGRLHLTTHQRKRDIARDELYRDLGLEVVELTAGDPGTRAFVTRLDQAYERRARQPRMPQAWTLRAPDWWVPTCTVAQRRALSPGQRSRWLRHRRAAA